PPDIAFLDIEMRTINGIDFAEKLILLNPNINIIFVTGYKNYMADAFAMHVSGYITKPVTEDKVRNELNNLRYPIDPKSRIRRTKFHTFGDFEVYIDDEPVLFTYAKTKELLAVLVDVGAMCSTGKCISMLWPDDDPDKHTSYIRNLVADLVNTFKEKDCNNVIIRKRGMIGIDRRYVICDYYDYMEGLEYAKRFFNREYMSQYSWGEERLATLLGNEL
nr:response regulator [Butyrivibrio sp.]